MRIPGYRAARLLCVLASGALCTHAEEFEQHHAHEHGKVTLNIAMDGSKLLVELDAPAINVVGFEHAPRTQSEKLSAEKATQLMRGGHALFGFPPGADCHFQRSDFTAPSWQGEHADYEPKFTYRCNHPAALAWLEPWLLGKLLNVTEARINIVTSTGQRSDRVTSPHARVKLE